MSGRPRDRAKANEQVRRCRAHQAEGKLTLRIAVDDVALIETLRLAQFILPDQPDPEKAELERLLEHGHSAVDRAARRRDRISGRNRRDRPDPACPRVLAAPSRWPPCPSRRAAMKSRSDARPRRMSFLSAVSPFPFSHSQDPFLTLVLQGCNVRVRVRSHST
jgi:hypothetical protein